MVPELTVQGAAGTVGSGTNQPLGNGTQPVFLNGGNLQFDTGSTARPDLTTGNVTLVGGMSTITATGTTTLNTVTLPGLTRLNNAGLTINTAQTFASNTGPAFDAGAVQKGTQVMIASGAVDIAANASATAALLPSGMVAINGTLAPWIVTSGQDGGDFMAYTANGLQATTYTLGGVPNVFADSTPANGHELSSAISTDIVRVQDANPTSNNVSIDPGNANNNNTADSSMTTDQTIFGLRFALSNSRNPVITSTTAGTGTTLTIVSGGLSADEQGNTVTIGSTTPANAVNVKFGGFATGDGITTEGVIWANTNVVFLNSVMASGLTLIGGGVNGGGATLFSAGDVISGPITVNASRLSTNSDAALGTGAGNEVVLNGGVLNFLSGTNNGVVSANTTITHNVQIGADGGELLWQGASTFTGAISDLATTGVAASPLSVNVGGNSVTFATSIANTYAGGTIIASTSTGSLVVADGTTLGTGDVTVYSGTDRAFTDNTVLTLRGSNNLAPTAGVDLYTGTTLNLTNAANPVVLGSIEGSGNIVLGASGSATTLSIGGNNRNTLFDGNISQAAGANASGLTKTGSGTFTLAGLNTYAGTTNVSAGSLIINGSIGAGNVNVLAGTLGGIGAIAGSVTVNSGAVLAPGNTGATGVLGTGSLNLFLGSTFSAQINGANPGAGYDQLIAGQVNLDATNLGSGVGATLNVSLGSFTPAANEVFVLINNTGSSPVSGVFQTAGGVPLANGATFTVGATTFKIFYDGGDGNDVVLVENTTPPPVVYVSGSNFGLASPPLADMSVMSGTQTAVFGLNAFSSVAAALAAVAPGGTVVVSAGTYAESPSFTGQTLQLSGNVTLSALDATSNSLVNLGANTLTVGTGDSLGHLIASPFAATTGSLVKAGSDTLTLSGNDAFTGGISISAGTLLVNGATSSSSTVSIGASGTLGGSGTIAGSVSSLGSVAPGSPGTPGTLSILGNVDFNPNATASAGILSIDLVGGSTSDKVAVLTMGSTVNLTGATLSLTTSGTINTGDTFTILTVPGGPTGTFAGGSIITVGSRSFSISYTGGLSHQDVVLTALAAGTGPSLVSTTLNKGLTYINSTLEPAQHSMVESVVYSFSSAISLSPSNFAIIGKPGSGTTIVPTLIVTPNGANTVWTVTFTGAGVNTTTHSIGDGEYRLSLTGVSGLADSSYDFFRLLGDMDGNGLVNIADFSTMVGTFLRATNDPAYLGADDLDGDNTVGIADINLLVGNFLHSVPQPLPN